MLFHGEVVPLLAGYLTRLTSDAQRRVDEHPLGSQCLHPLCSRV
ncbi:MAG: hypothetical protein BLITH_0539 [Brockia lithotrophica]|uniref:Uncharacterized protein n=1 Tax=Brockia lithotrophica TaxID=933949 RepID=A0A2T5G4L0_9BACL|nr:MAG: hypothetical protein BLITH_0539 [Brockia lithotrophica]